jgi:hypothetical protein
VRFSRVSYSTFSRLYKSPILMTPLDLNRNGGSINLACLGTRLTSALKSVLGFIRVSDSGHLVVFLY